MSQAILGKLKTAIIERDEATAVEAAAEAVAAKVDVMDAIENGLAAGMVDISELFDEGEVFVPELVQSAKVFEAAVAVLTEGLSAEDKAKSSRGKILLHTVEGDIHNIGKNLVHTMLVASGFDVIDMGVNVPVSQVVETAQKEKVDIIAGSALLTTTMPRMKEIVDLLTELGVRDQFMCMFGGAPVVDEWALEFADGYAETASGAVRVALELMEKKKG